MILVINICNEKLHSLEFVKPVCDIFERRNEKYFVRHYLKIKKEDLKKADRVIICGTSLLDNEFVKNIKKFEWIKSFEKPLLGICGGMQVIGLIFNGKVERGSEIGYYKEDFNFEFLGLEGSVDVYHLHNNFVNFENIVFRIFASNGFISQAVKHKDKNIYGVLFHPEVRNKDLIIKFCSL